MKSVWEEIKPEIRWLLVAGGLPCLFFMLGVGFSFLVYPYDAESASKVLMIFGGTGALLGIFMIIHRIRQILKKLKRGDG